MIAWGSLFLCHAAMGLVALSMERHQADLIGGAWARQGTLALRLGGFALLGAAAWACGLAFGPSVGLAVWCGQMAVAATSVGLMLTYRPRHLVRSLVAALVAALAVALMLALASAWVSAEAAPGQDGAVALQPGGLGCSRAMLKQSS